MRKMRKVVCMFLVAAVMLMLFMTGCGNSNTTTTATTTGSSTVATEPTKAPLAPYTIDWFMPGTMEKGLPAVSDEVNKYLKDKINATVNFNYIDWSTYPTKMKAMTAAGEKIDILFTAAWLAGVDYIGLVRSGAIIATNDLMDKFAPKTKELLGDMFINASKVDGKNYGIPCNKEKARAYCILYNKTMADKYSLDLSTVKTLKDLEPALEVIKQKEPDSVPFFGNFPYGLIPWASSAPQNDGIWSVGVINSEGKAVNQYETTEVKDLYDTMRELYTKGYEMKDMVQFMNKRDLLAKPGKVFAKLATGKPYVELEGAADQKANGWEQGVVFLTEPSMANADTMGSIQAISKNSNDAERSMMLLELVNTDKFLNNLINFGIEGVNYTKKSDNVMAMKAETGYNGPGAWMIGNQFLNYLTEAEPADKFEKYASFNANATPAPDLGFTYNGDAFKTESAKCDGVLKQYVEALAYGMIDPTKSLPELITKLKAAGSDKIVTELQTQFDAWKASK
jgi:putative aldouronate transport system substrate-binding protein